MRWIFLVFLITVLTAIAVLPETLAQKGFVFDPPPTKVIITRHETSETTDFKNGTYTTTLGLPPRLADSKGNFAKDYYLYNNTGTSYTIATGFGTYVFVKSSCGIKLFPPTQTPDVASINAITLTIAHSAGNYYVKDILGACNVIISDNGTSLVINGTRSNENATFTERFVLNGGKPMESTYSIIPKIKGMIWKITEAQNDIPNVITTNTAKYEESNKYDPKNSTITSIISTIKNGGHIITYTDSNGQKIFYDYETSVLALNQTAINLDVKSGKTQLYNDYQSKSLGINEPFIIDPVFGYTTTTWNYRIDNEDAATCNVLGPFSNNTLAAGDGTAFNYIMGAGTSGYCRLSILRWDLSSIPVSAVVSDVKIKFDSNVVGPSRPCDFWSLETPHTSSLATAWADAVSGTRLLGPNNFCQFSAVGQVFDFNATGIIDVQNHLGVSNSLWGVGFTLDTNDRTGCGGGNCDSQLHSVQLQVTYNSPQAIYVFVKQHDNSTALYPASVLDKNSTNSVTLNTNTTGFAGPFNTGGGTLQNFTTKDLTSNFVVNKTLNFNPVSNRTFAERTFAFQVDCPSNGAGNDILLETNDTDGHHMTTFSTPTCSSNSTLSWGVKFTANGKSTNTFTSKVYGKVLSPASYGGDPLFVTINGTQFATSYNSGTNTITSVPFTVAKGTQTKFFNFTMRLLGPTLASAPRNLTAAPSGNDKITLNWLAPSSNGSSAIFGYHIFRNGTTLVNNTATLAKTYTNTGIQANHKQTYQLCAWNTFGCSAMSNQAFNYTYAATTAIASINYTRVGDMIGVSPAINVTTGNPSPTVTKIEFYNKTTLLQTTTPNTIAPTGSKSFFPIMYNGLLGVTANSNYTVKISLTNATGVDIVFTSNSTGLVARAYLPSYFTAVDSSQGQVNYTVSRTPDQSGVILQANREKNAALFNMECLYQTANEIATTPQQVSGGQWDNHSSIGYYKNTHNDFNSFQNVYISCYNSGLLFTTTSYANATLLAGINYFDNTFQGFIGVPVGVFFILLVAGLATGRTAPTITVIVLAVTAIMAGIGFFVVGQAVWGLCLIAAACALFGGKKFL